MPATQSVEKSWLLRDRALRSIPLATQTHSKAARESLRDIEPCYIIRGDGCRVWDVDDNEYIDFRSGLGPITLGYRFPAVDDAVRRQLDDGIIFSYPHPIEVEVAERLVRLIPCAESVRFLKTGGEAMAAAHRLARAFTGRDLLLTCGYHGWVNRMSGPGVPEIIQGTYRGLPWGDASPYEAAFREAPGEIAAVSVACSYADIDKGHGFLADLRDLTERHGALLIFDEIVTGFRLALGGAGEYFGVTPDLAVFAKGISNGVPLSCYVGRADVMARVADVNISSTFGGDTLGLATARAALDTYEREDVIETLWARGKQLMDGVNAHSARLGIAVRLEGLPPMPELTLPGGGALRTRLEGELLKRGVMIYTVCYPSFSHGEADVAEAVAAIGDALDSMAAQGMFT
ncbi:aminotransferase class III-fold pyridoxal phosphate-dependent enzyme [Candidatus Poribacteria bacterium]|jgi:glutamate-1-semialdehyde 2,1-aminomutase|nr:aminotransferase class III-fold pyridoxal phosphate-dependent enzyme [Candidatus Poribacteria bacterium]MBT5536136.1 aminotransferase class III-fold pyridoxal phosphate-dependent enzyme [Candidatus Poribacteria bacterium]MBT7097270.1 aminotransferase class III-fold pyridoxal phosphate-dependent enzyme [Candidatus Poribacteria bacterium]MBT7806657.1 aminotransferase class III-fold pyridoxal phosphate-dependent enzyme [Candidatus Poribacteria bacterium]